MKRKYVSLTLTSLMLLGSAVVASANVPPPPVNQTLGIADSVFNNLKEANCRACHENPNITKPGYIPDRHHLKVGKTIVSPSDVPYSTGGVSGSAPAYECLSCHQLVADPANPGAFKFAAFRDCLICHIQTPGGATVHHRTQAAKLRNCKACHGYLDNPNDGHYIPTYPGSLVTPKTGKGTGPGGSGGCSFCHDAGTDNVSKVMVYTNAQTHHSTGVVLGPYTSSYGPDCLLCHEISSDSVNFPKVRKCENCHSVSTLHNIQQPGADGKITPGTEPAAYWGHIGQQADCWGCHGFTAATMTGTEMVSDAICPNANSLDNAAFSGGANTPVTVNGSAFMNEYQGTMLTSLAKITNKATGQTMLLAPAQITDSALTAVMPGYTAAGNYTLQLVKNDKTSGALGVSVSPKMAITKATCQVNGNYANLVIQGQGFGAFYMGMAASNAGVGVSGDGTACAVNAWSDGDVRAACKTTTCPSSVAVDGMWASASAGVGQTNACAACHQANMDGSVTCDNMSAHTRRAYLDAAQAKVATDAKGLTCTTVVNNPKNRSRKN
jgi:hypothetical protein